MPRRLRPELFALLASRPAVMHHDRQSWREARDASFRQLPTTEVGQISSAGRASPASRIPLQQRQGLHRLAQPHVVGQAGAQPPAGEEFQPRIAAHLIGP